MKQDEEQVVHDPRENWTEQQWQEYNEFIADAVAEEEDEMIQDYLEMEADY